METARCRAFVAAAETGSFSKAAEALSYTPSGVNQLVTALEKEFGFPLFRRNTKGVALTENGELLLPVHLQDLPSRRTWIRFPVPLV